MLTYAARRVALSVVVMFGLLVATFVIIHLVPGDPVQQLLGSRATPQAIAAARQELGLDRPLLSQFASFAGGVLRGDLGRSIPLNATVASVIGPRLLPSGLLIAYGLFLALLIGVPLALLAAVRPNRAVDNLVRFATTFTFAMPTFWLGLMLALVLGLELGWFPVSGYERGVAGFFRTLTLPALTIGLSLAVVVVRTLRSSLLEVLQSEYVEAARSRGMSRGARGGQARHAQRGHGDDHDPVRERRLPHRRDGRDRGGLPDPGRRLPAACRPCSGATTS